MSQHLGDRLTYRDAKHLINIRIFKGGQEFYFFEGVRDSFLVLFHPERSDVNLQFRSNL